ncbi:MAG: hypothetical protein LBQ92_02495 [Propionibacteriaceae bacterium]|jgi:fructoselysine-6-P-deglycase FrlB-like protein|nr:hypothetical protein [Propionibacteriaceae bacterium]
MVERADFTQAVLAQGRWLAQIGAQAASAFAARSPRPLADGETVAVIAMGASTAAGEVFTRALRERGVRALNFDASAAAAFPQGYAPAEHLVIISESGRSPEPIAAAGRFGPAQRIVITNDLASPTAKLGETVIWLGGFLDSGVYTIGYTTTLAALAWVAKALGVPIADPDELAASGQPALDSGDGAGEIAAVLRNAQSLDVVASGCSYGSAVAAALLLREVLGLPASAWETYQYLHGPSEAAPAAGSVLLYGGAREDALAQQLREAGIALARVPAAKAGFAGAIAEAVPVQLATAQLARERGIDVGAWRLPQPDIKLPA